MRSLVLLADTRENPFQRPEVMWGMGLLVLALLVGAAVISAVDRWRKRATAGPTDADTTGALTSFRAMYENGEITEAEYTELRRRVAEKVKKPDPKPDAPAPAVSPARPGEPPTGGPPATPNPTPDPPPSPGTT